MEAILRGAGCDHVALGNAIPTRYGQQAVAGLAKAFGRPLLCVNMREQDGQLVQGLEPFIIQTLGPINIAIIGLTAPNDSYTSFFKLRMDQPESILPALIADARAAGASTIVLLSHLASTTDQALAEAIEGIDVIIGGHDHRELDPPLVVRDTIIAQAGDFGRFLGRLDLVLDPRTGKVVQHTGKLLPVAEDIPLDPETESVAETERKRAFERMNRRIGTLHAPIELSDVRECAAGNLLADALLERIQAAELAIVLAGHWEEGLDAGDLTEGTLFTANRSTANPTWVWLTGEQILNFLRKALKPENAARKLHALRGRPVGMPHIAGGSIHYDGELKNIELEIAGKPLEEQQQYVVVSTDMEFSDYLNYLVIPFEQMEFDVPTIMPEVLENYIRQHSPVQAPASGRIRLRAK